MHKFCKEHADKKYDIWVATDFEVEYLSDENNNNVEISNERHGMLYKNSDEGNITIDS